MIDCNARANGGPFAIWQNQTKQTSAIYNGQLGHTYAFYTVATDNVGNVQPTPAQAQAATFQSATLTESAGTTKPTAELISTLLNGHYSRQRERYLAVRASRRRLAERAGDAVGGVGATAAQHGAAAV